MSDTKKFSGPVRVGSKAGDPSDNDPGQIYFNSGSDNLKFKNSTIWKTVMGSVSDDTAPSLGGNLDVNTKRIVSSTGEILVAGQNSFRRAKASSFNSFIEEEYIHSTILYNGATDLIIPSLSFDVLAFEGCKIDYKMKDTAGEVRVGTMLIATNGTVSSIFDGPSVQTGLVDISFGATIAPVIGATAATATLNTTAPVMLTDVVGGAYRNTDTFTLQVNAAAPNPTNTVLAAFTGTSAAITCTITPNDGTNNGGAAATATLNTTTPIVLTSTTPGSFRNTDTFTLVVNAAAPNPTDTVLANFTGTSAAIVLTITPNDGTNNGATPVNLTTANIVELIGVGSVTGVTVTVTDGSSLRILQSAFGGDNTFIVNGGEGDGEVGTFTGGVDSGVPVDLSTAELVELISIGSVTGVNVTVTGNELRALQTATGGDTTILVNGGEGDGEVGTFTGGVDGTNGVIVTYTAGAENAEIRMDVKRIKT